MQIAINTADDERCTFKKITWFDFIVHPPKPRRPSVGAEPAGSSSRALSPSPGGAVRKGAGSLVASPEPLLVLGFLLAGLSWKRFWRFFFLSCWFTDRKERLWVWKSTGDILPRETKKQTVWVENRTSFALFTWWCHVQFVKSKGCPQSV